MKYLYIVLLISSSLLGCSTAKIDLPQTSTQRIPASAWQANGNMDQTLPTSDARLFSTPEIIRMKLTGDFQRVHEANAGGNWTGDDREDPSYWSDGILVDLAQPNRQITQKLRARGMSSASPGEADFPKLRVEINDNEDLKQTVFKGSRNFKINTHVSTHPQAERTGMGRLNNEKSPFREAVAYEVGSQLLLPAPLIRRAKIAYTDTLTKESFERNALLIETDKKIAERFGAKVSETFPEEAHRMNIRLAARFHAFNILIGNEDIGLKLKKEPTIGTEKYRPYFNTTIFELPSGEMFPVIYDFDLSTFVSGWGMLSWDLFTLPPFQINDGRVGRFFYNLAMLRSRLSQQEYTQAIQDVLSQENQIRQIINTAVADSEFKVSAAEHFDLYKTAVKKLETYPMLLKNGVRFYKDPALTEDLLKMDPVQETPGTLRPGTPIQVLQDKGNVVQIAICDFKHDLSNYEQMVGYIQKSDLVLGYDLPENLQGIIDGRDMAW